MLKITLHEGSHPEDVCDYCRKQTGQELITLELTARKWTDRQYIQIHVHCLERQVKKQRTEMVAA